MQYSKLDIYNGQEAAAVEGAKISDDGIIETFHNDEEALDAANNGVAVCRLSTFFLLVSFFFWLCLVWKLCISPFGKKSLLVCISKCANLVVFLSV